jgi:hypothetical protein
VLAFSSDSSTRALLLLNHPQKISVPPMSSVFSGFQSMSKLCETPTGEI